MTVLLCPVAVIRSGLKRQRGVHVTRAGSPLLETLHLQEDPRWVSNAASTRIYTSVSHEPQIAVYIHS